MTITTKQQDARPAAQAGWTYPSYIDCASRTEMLGWILHWHQVRQHHDACDNASEMHLAAEASAKKSEAVREYLAAYPEDAEFIAKLCPSAFIWPEDAS